MSSTTDKKNTSGTRIVSPGVAPVERVLVPLADGRWLALDRPAFEAALVAGSTSIASSSQSQIESTRDPLVDAEQAAVQLGLTARWLEDSARAGIVPHHKFGRFIRFRVSDVAAHFQVDGATPA